MFLIGDCNRAAIKVNALAGKEYPRLRKENQIETLLATQTKEGTLSMALLNKRSLGKHFHDILIDKHLFSNYIIVFNETRLAKRKDRRCKDEIRNNFLVYFFILNSKKPKTQKYCNCLLK